jgi:hypothetical protein
MKRERALHEVFWTISKPAGSEYCLVSKGGGGWTLAGTVAWHIEAETMVAAYTIRTDGGWRTKKVQAEQLLNGMYSGVRLESRRGRWFVDGKERPDLEGCVDVDLGASPVTNALPIKRNRIEVGTKIDLTAAWVRFPSLEVLPLKQSYERVGARRFVYRSNTGFKAELELDGFGMVRRYGDYWTAV